MGTHEAHTWERRNMYKIFVGETEDTKQLGKPRRRSEDNIKMEIRNIGLKGIRQTHDSKRLRALLNTAINFQVLQKAGNFLPS
jgi:hypothetical protein